MIDEMVTIEFEYNKIKTEVEIGNDNIFQDAVNIFLTKEKLNLDSIEFTYDNKKIDLNEKIETLINNQDKDNINNNILIQVTLKKDDENINKIDDNFEIRCPKCYEPCQLKINNYLIKLYGCKYNHRIENIELDEFSNIKNIMFPILKCKMCEKDNKNEPKKEFHHCLKCKINLCSDCFSSHEKKT